MNRLKAIIVDDEKCARAATRIIVGQNFGQIEIVAEAAGVSEAVEAIAFHKPDLLFLDIEINEGSGFDVLQQIRPRNMQVIFITAFNHFAIKAFKYSATDYILKPVDPEELITAINRVLQNNNPNLIESQLELMQFNKNNQNKKLALPTQKGLFLVHINEIIRCQAESSYTQVYTKNKRSMVSKTLKDYEELLVPHHFFRIHQSHLVNLDFIEEFSHEDGGVLILEDGSRLPVARRRKDKLLELLRS